MRRWFVVCAVGSVAAAAAAMLGSVGCVGDDPLLSAADDTHQAADASTDAITAPVDAAGHDGGETCATFLPRNSVGVFRPSNGLFYLAKLPGAPSGTEITAQITDAPIVEDTIPLIGDWDGDGVSGIAVYKASEKKLWLRNELSAGPADKVTVLNEVTGGRSCVVVAGRFERCGADEPGICCLVGSGSDAPYECRLGGRSATFSFGVGSDAVVFGDWNGDGIETVGVYRPSLGSFLVRNTNDFGKEDDSFTFYDGSAPDDVDLLPVSGAFFGDKNYSFGIYDRSTLRFDLRSLEDGGSNVFPMGVASDIPVSGRFVR